MLPVLSEFASTLLAVLFCGAAIKLTDDYLDQEEDRLIDRWNWSILFGEGMPVYAMLFFSFATIMDFAISVSFFWASYTIGMFLFPGRKYTSRLQGWQESLFIIVMGILFLGWRNMLFALTFITAIQLVDDCMDRKLDRYNMSDRGNWACRFGTIECLLVAGILLLVAYRLILIWFYPAIVAAIALFMINFWQERKGIC